MSNGMNSLQFGDYTLDRPLRQLRRGETPVALPGKAFELLAYMAANAGRPLPKSELLAAVWPDAFVEESNLSQNVFLLRKALGADGPIVTLPGRGYQFAAQVTELAASNKASPAAPVTELEATHSRLVYEEHTEERIALLRSPLALAGVLIGLAALATAGWLGWQRYEDRVGGPPVQVVLTDLDGGTGDPVLDRTLKDVLRIELAQSPFVTMVPGSSVRQVMVQMLHKADDPLPASIAREVCERTASQAVVQGAVAHVGKGFLVTEQATNCKDGTSLGAAKAMVDRPEGLPRAVETLAATLRHTLGESRRTIARFSTPLAAVSTGSLEALQDYSQAMEQSRHSRYAESIQLLKQAVQLDPQFAAAYMDLSSFSYNTLDPGGGERFLKQAYAVRDHATEPTRLLIVARYNGLVTGDRYESERNYKAWIGIYPRQVVPWSGLTNLYVELGRPADGLVAAKRTLELAPGQAVAYQALADMQIRSSDVPAARATLESAFSHGFDSENLRYLRLRVGYLQHDAALIAEQEAWLKAHPDSPVLLCNLAAYALGQGRFAETRRIFVQMVQAFEHTGSPAAGGRMQQAMALAFMEVGEMDEGRQMLHRGPIEPMLDTLIAQAESGDPAGAQQTLRVQLAEHPQDTIWQKFYEPAVSAQLAMLGGRPQEAIADLERARAFDGRSADCIYLRGKAFLQAQRLPEAEAEFRRLLTHPGIQADAYQLPMAQLYLARTLAAQGRAVEARAAYKVFLDIWRHADPDAVLLKQANRELAAMAPAA